ncbi:MAG: hypothetical protein Hyperionvirus2_92 [Hyperionvirus sp.]|uniref:Sel1 repeat family protein n=1 Tax=Hyperionvirus sp. TaxID=2487770 RepID=A0A3G5A874_9VIRU|nr:MAG: hypothetical protein Hyperionvirus2_92 [Hyperionvirus sp.]
MGNRSAKLAAFDYLEVQNNTYPSNKIRNFCEEHIKNGNSDAAYALGMLYLNKYNWDIDAAFKYLSLAVDRGNKEALMNLGLIYYYGSKMVYGDCHDTRKIFQTRFISKKPYSGEEKAPPASDYKKSFELLNQAEVYLNGTRPMIYVYLGAHHEYGLNVDRCEKKALECYEKAYVSGYNCIQTIYRFYTESKSVDISTDECLNWISKAELGLVKGAGDFLIRIFEARKNYDSAIAQCRKELKKYESGNNYDSYKSMLAGLIEKKRMDEFVVPTVEAIPLTPSPPPPPV